MITERSADPPAGAPWDVPLHEAPLVFLDLEMTGLRSEQDRVIEIHAERVVGGRVESVLSSLVRPECGTSGNVHVHGIGPEHLASAPVFAELADRVEEILRGGILVAHAASWDVAFLEAELARAGRPQRVPHYLDTLTLSRRAFALPSHSLAALCTEFGVSPGHAHRAPDDVRALRQIWDRIVAALTPRTPRDLWHVRIGERHARPEIVAAAVQAAERGLPVRIRYRPSRRGPEVLTMQITGVRTDLDPPRVLGYLLPARGRRELRADRILAVDSAEPPGTTGPRGP